MKAAREEDAAAERPGLDLWLANQGESGGSTATVSVGTQTDGSSGSSGSNDGCRQHEAHRQPQPFDACWLNRFIAQCCGSVSNRCGEGTID